MMTTTRTRIAALLLAAATLTTACGSSTTQQAVPIGSADPFPGSSGSSSTAATTTTTAAAPSTSVSPADAAGQAAAAFTHYLDVYNQLLMNGGDVAVLSTVASGIEITNRTNDLAASRARGDRFTSGSAALSSSVGAVDSSVVPATAKVSACVAGGVPVGQASSAPRPAQRGTFYLTNPAWPDPSGWRVSDSDLRGETCSA